MKLLNPSPTHTHKIQKFKIKFKTKLQNINLSTLFTRYKAELLNTKCFSLHKIPIKIL